MKALLVLACAICFVVAQDERPTPRPDGTEAPPTPRCTMDSFTIARNCHMDCLRADDTTGCIIGCNLVCNTSRSGRTCPDSERCTLGCVLRRDPDNGCPVCQCDETDPERPGEELNPCLVNATVFARRARCHLRCLFRRSEDQCFMCNRTCNGTATPDNNRDECGVRDPTRDTDCPEGSICLLDGVLNRCVTRPGNNEMCDRDGSDPRDLDDGDEDDDDDEFRRELDDDDSDFFDRIEGAEDRLRAFSIQSSADIEPCAEGFRCTGSDDTQRCTMITGPCITMRATNAQVLCDEDGYFEPLQCRRMNDGTHTCRCVHPRNGSMVAGTEVPRVTERDEAPDCESRVFRRCNYRQGGRNFTVRHGDSFVNRDTCMRCRCNNGAADNCERDAQVDCRRLNPGTSPLDCTRGRITIEHGMRMKVGDCNLCGCNNGRLTCTDIEECEGEGDEDDEQETRCESCQDAPQRLVCGRDGRTYRSRCIAMNCTRRLRDEDILEGPCSSQPVCRLYPCRSGYTCVPLGGRTCLRNEGCTADERRICVNRNELRCRVSNMTREGFDATNEDVVCGSDRRNYRSICHLIQQAPPNTRVAHSGECEMRECTRGSVCGTDGVTYNSSCHLRAQSANAQVDYMGDCEDTDDSQNLREICRRVREETKRCNITREICQRRVMSRDGCCPICGGITTMAIDRQALDEYSRATNSDANLDEFMARMTRDDVIPDSVRERCRVEVTHVRNSTETNIEVKMMAKDPKEDAVFCHRGSMDFADKINGEAEDSVTVTLPVEASFAGAAVAAPLIEDDGSSGAPALVASSLAVLGVAIMAAIF